MSYKIASSINLPFSALLLSVLLLPLSCSSTQPVQQHETTERILHLLQASEIHYNGLKRSLGDLNEELRVLDSGTTMGILNARSANSDDLAQLLSSFHAFCEDLQGQNATPNVAPTITNSSISTVPPVGAGKPTVTPLSDWFPPPLNVIPVTVEITYHWNEAVVIFTVMHFTSGYVTPSLEKFDTGKVSIKKLRLRPHEKVPKTSKVKFRVKTGWCEEKQDYDRQETSFTFAEARKRFPTQIVVSLDMCKFQDNIFSYHGTYDMATNTVYVREDIIIPQFYTSMRDLVIVPGKKQSESFDLMLTTYAPLHFGVSILYYDNIKDTVSQSFWSMYEYEEEEGKYQLDMHESASNKKTNLEIDDISFDSRENNTEDAQPARNETEPREIRYRLTVNVTSDSDNGIIYLARSVRNESQNTDIRSTNLHVPVYIKGRGETFPFPEGTFMFTGRSHTFCNTNPLAEDESVNRCSIQCSFLGVDIKDISVYKNDSSWQSKKRNFRLRSAISPSREWAAAYLDYTGDIPTAAKGEYVCEVTSVHGKTAHHTVTLVVGGSPAIDENATRIEDFKNETALVTCAASGSNLTLEIYVDDDSAQTRLDNNSSYTLVVKKPAPHQLVYELFVPTSILRWPTNVILCKVKNEFGERSEFKYTHTALDDYYGSDR